MCAQLYRRKLRGPVAIAAFCGIGVVASLGALAQAPAGKPGAAPAPGAGGRMGGGGGRQGGRGGGMGFGGGRMRMTAAMMPVSALNAELKLTDKQQTQIKDIQDKFRKDMMAMRPAGGPGGPGGRGGAPGGPGGAPRPGGGPNAGGRPGPGGPGGPGGGGGQFGPPQADIKKMQDLSTKATSSIEAVLTQSQKKELPAALKEIGTMRNAGIPLETLGDLKLTSAQKVKIASIADKAQKDVEVKVKAANGDIQAMMPVLQQARQKTHTDVMATLTASQKGVIDKYEKDHPRGRGGFGGGMGGPGGGGRRGGGGPGGPGGAPGGPGGRPGA